MTKKKLIPGQYVEVVVPKQPKRFGFCVRVEKVSKQVFFQVKFMEPESIASFPSRRVKAARLPGEVLIAIW